MSLSEFLSSFGLSALPLLILIAVGLSLSAWVKIATVLAILRAGLGAFSLPGAFVTGALAMALSYFVMQPTIERSLGAMQSAGLGQAELSAPEKARAIDAGMKEWKKFVQAHADEEVVSEFVKTLESSGANAAAGSVPTSAVSSTELANTWRVLAPSFFISELRDAFKTGLSLFLPFVIIDLVVAWLLALVGVSRLDPSIVALPLKLLLFVLVDGWGLIGRNLVETYL